MKAREDESRRGLSFGRDAMALAGVSPAMCATAQTAQEPARIIEALTVWKLVQQ